MLSPVPPQAGAAAPIRRCDVPHRNPVGGADRKGHGTVTTGASVRGGPECPGGAVRRARAGRLRLRAAHPGRLGGGRGRGVADLSGGLAAARETPRGGREPAALAVRDRHQRAAQHRTGHPAAPGRDGAAGRA